MDRDELGDWAEKMVFWDEKPEVIFQRLRANGFSGAEAEELYQAACQKRIEILQAEGWKSLGKGVLAFGSGWGAFYFLGLEQLSAAEFGDGVSGTALLPWLLALGCAALWAYACWKAVQGLAEIFLAKGKRGSLAGD